MTKRFRVHSAHLAHTLVESKTEEGYTVKGELPVVVVELLPLGKHDKHTMTLREIAATDEERTRLLEVFKPGTTVEAEIRWTNLDAVEDAAAAQQPEKSE